MAQTIETTPTGATAVTLKSAQISEFLRGLGVNEERKLTLKEHLTACFEDFREAIEVKGYSYESLAQQLKEIGLQVSARSLRDAYTEVKKGGKQTAKTAPTDATTTSANGGSTSRKLPVKAPAPKAGE